MVPDGSLRLELAHVMVTQGTVITEEGPIKYAPLQSLLMAPIYAAGFYYDQGRHNR